MKESFEKLLDYISPRISSPLYVIDEGIKNNVNEIRLRLQKPVALGVKEKTMFLMKNGGLTNVPTSDTVIAEAEDIEKSFLLVCRHSVHSCEEELASSFVTLPCGSRVGISGEAISDNGTIKSFGSVSSLNYRVPASCRNAADPIREILSNTEGLVIGGPPSSGKTTLVRECARLLSDGVTGKYERVCLIDPRNELSATLRGRAQNDIGLCTDVIINKDTALSIKNAIRVMNPSYIVLDEIMTDEEMKGVAEGVGCGVRFVLTVHCGSAAELLRKPIVKRLVDIGGLSDAVFIGYPGAVPCVVDLK